MTILRLIHAVRVLEAAQHILRMAEYDRVNIQTYYDMVATSDA